MNQKQHKTVNNSPKKLTKQTTKMSNDKQSSPIGDVEQGKEEIKNIAWAAWKQVYIINTHTGYEIGADDPTSELHDWDMVYLEFDDWWSKTKGIEIDTFKNTQKSNELKDIITTIRNETVPMADHPDPKAIDDCWRTVFEIIAGSQWASSAHEEKAIGLLREHSEILDTPNTSTMPIEEYQKLFNRMEEWRERSRAFLKEVNQPKAVAPKADVKSKEEILHDKVRIHRQEFNSSIPYVFMPAIYEAMEEYANQFKINI